MWDILIITAGSESQAADFRLQLENIAWGDYAREIKVIPDVAENGRIGSGGSTLFVLHNIFKEYRDKLNELKVLLLHSGGLSQRMPHLSAFGKLFAHLPGPTTALELKLETYKKFSELLPNGLLIGASDVIEDTSFFKQPMEKEAEMLLFATESDEQTASQHGVFVMEEGKLKSVLQKPGIEEMRKAGAIRGDGSALTDCFYWMNWRLCEKLASLIGTNPITSELCCYGDFMRPLGAHPSLEYLKEGSSNLQLWRKDLADVFSGVDAQIFNLGPEAFFHLGTPSELLEHFDKASRFSRKFIKEGASRAVFSRIGKFSKGSYAEFCDIPKATVNSGCILSGLETNDPVLIPKDVMMFTISCKGGFVTAAFGIHDDIKKKEKSLVWMGHRTEIQNHSLWSAPLFLLCQTKEASLISTLDMIQNGIPAVTNLISLETAVKSADIKEMLRDRERMKKTFI